MEFYVENHGPLGRIVIMLDCAREPEIVEHFAHLCLNGYEGSKIDKIIEDLLLEAGDSVSIDGRPEIFPNVPHGTQQRFGTLSMLLEENGSVGCKFNISLTSTFPILKHQVAIGRVIKGLQTLSAFENFSSRFGVLREAIVIQSCGMFR